MDHATTALAAIRDPAKFVKVPDVVLFDAHEQYDEDGKLVRRFGREELQEICDNTNARRDGGDPTVIGLGHTIPRDPITKMPAPEKNQPESVGYAMDLRVGQFGPRQKTGILADYYIAKDKMEEWKSYLRGRSVELWPKQKVIDWVASLRKAPQRDLGPLDLSLLTYSRDTIETFTPTRKFYGDAAKTRVLAMAQRGEKLFYAMEDADGQPEAFSMDPTKPADAAAPDDDFAAKIDRYMAEKYPSLTRMCQEATERYAAESDPNAVGAPAGTAPEAPKPGEMPPGEAVPGADPNSQPDAGAVNTGPGSPSSTNTSIPGSEGKKKKKPEDDEGKEKLRMAADTEAIRYARLEEEVKQLRTERELDKAAAKKAKATQRIQALQYQGFTLDPVREVERYCALDETVWDKEDETIKRYYKQDSVGHVPMGGMFQGIGGDAPAAPAVKGNMTREQMQAATRLATKKGVDFGDAVKEVLAGV